MTNKTNSRKNRSENGGRSRGLSSVGSSPTSTQTHISATQTETPEPQTGLISSSTSALNISPADFGFASFVSSHTEHLAPNVLTRRRGVSTNCKNNFHGRNLAVEQTMWEETCALPLMPLAETVDRRSVVLLSDGRFVSGIIRCFDHTGAVVLEEAQAPGLVKDTEGQNTWEFAPLGTMWINGDDVDVIGLLE